MIHSSLIRLLMLPVVLLMTLMACNLSSSAGTSTESLQVIITATSNALVETDIEASSEIEADEDDTITETIQTSNQTVQQITSISNQAVGGEDLYYVRGSRSATQCAIRASVTTNIRTASNTSASIVGQLVGGEWVPISRIVNGWYQIDLSGTPAHRMWISSDPTELDEFCRCETNGCARSQTIPTPTVNDNWYYAGNPMPAPPSGCFVFTAGDFNVNIRVAQSETSTILGQLRANHWIPVRHLINGWFGITAPNTPIDGAYIASGPSQLSSTCLCTDVSCTVRTDAISCELTTHANTVTKVRTEPANWSSVVGELTAGEQYIAVAQSTSGWYQLQIGGWVAPSYLKLLSDSGCRNLPRITYDAPIFTCDLVNTTPEIVVIVKEPDGDYFGRFWPNNQLGIISRQGKWVQVYVAAFENAGWVDSTGMTLSGDCGNFQ